MKRITALLIALLLAVFGIASTAQAAPPPHRGILSVATAPWSDSLAEVGMPATPQMWQPSNFDVTVHTRSMNQDSGNETHMADHGSDCSAPPAQHQVSSWQEAVFACHSHVMTAIADSGYGEIALTPDHMADWSGGPVTVGWSVSTARTTSRDWIAVDITPFGQQFSLPFDFGDVDLAGMPKTYIELKDGLDDFNGIQNHWQLQTQSAGNDFGNKVDDEFPYFTEQTGIQPSATVRTPFEFTFDKTHYLFRVAPSAPVGGGTIIFQGNWPQPLTFTQGVVQFMHHSYNPFKCDVVAISCTPDTWHWSDFNISSAVPYTLLRPTDHQVVTEPGGVASFASPAPANSFLKFQGIGNIQVSYDGGKTFSAAKLQTTDGYNTDPSHYNNYFSPVPAGATSVQFRLSSESWYGPGQARDFSIVSMTTDGTPPPPPPPTPSPTPVPPTPTPVPPTPNPTPSPVPLNKTPCMITQNGVMVNGLCDGTFYPNQ